MRNKRRNWKTTLVGIATGLPTIVLGIITKDYVKIAEGIGLVILGAVAKDYDSEEKKPSI